jgi:GNAT superfamily N-acetyltransferase
MVAAAAMAASSEQQQQQQQQLCVRTLLPSDVPAACDLFAAGMAQTITCGLRRELLSFSVPRTGGMLLLFAACHAASMWLELWPRSPAAALTLTALLPAALILLVYVVMPRKAAFDYINKSLSTDMADPIRHYVQPARNGFWVATTTVACSRGDAETDSATESPGIQSSIVGTVAVEAADPSKEELGFRWQPGDAELRRMSVCRRAQGQGIAQRLFRELQTHAVSQGYRRIVLSTSTMQEDACRRLYPRLGFELVHRAPVFGGVHICFFALELERSTTT